MRQSASRALTYAGLWVLTPLTVFWITGNFASGTTWALIFSVLPLLALITAGLRPIRNWAEITALLMIPYVCAGVMDVVASSGKINVALGVAVVATGVFFSALDTARRPKP